MLGSGYGGTPLVALALRVVCVSVVVSLPSGCIFHLDDPIPAAASGGTSGAGGTPSDGGAAGATSGGTSSGGSGAGGEAGASGAGGAADCPMGTKRCGDCVSIDDPAVGCAQPGCDPCTKTQPNTAKTSCSAGKCVVESCLDGYGDCDGLDDNGCEINFESLPQASGPIASVDAFQSSTRIEIDGLATDPDWVATAARRQRISDVCLNCTTQAPIPKVVDPTLPPVTDLEAWFRIGWDASALYALFEVRDDEIVLPQTPLPPGDVAQWPSVLEDAAELLISLDRSHGGFGQDDMQLFYGVDGTVARPNQSVGPPGGGNKFKVKKGRGCYTVEIQLLFSYMDPEMKFTPMLGQQIGFTAAINDWDNLQQPDGGLVPQRQFHIFSKNPGDQYWVNADSFATLVLAGPQ